MSLEITNKEPISMAEVKSILSSEKELDFRMQKTLDYLNEFTKLDEKQAKELIEKINSLGFVRLTPNMVVKIVDLLPRSEGELKAVLSQFSITLTKDQLKSLLNVIAEYL